MVQQTIKESSRAIKHRVESCAMITILFRKRGLFMMKYSMKCANASKFDKFWNKKSHIMSENVSACFYDSDLST